MMTQSQRSGATFLCISFVTIVLINLVLIGRKISTDKAISVDLVRFGLTVTLLGCVWLGMVWARWLLVILLLAAGLFGLIAGLARLIPELLPIAVVYLGSAIGLFVPPVRSFLAYQRAKRA
jgi:hypothetical protein